MDRYGFHDPTRAPDPVLWEELARPLPAWFADAKLGILIHWGAYSLPAWAEPIGELGRVDERQWFGHNPYAEWYWNTIRFEASPARQHHREVYGDAAYDDFLDDWVADAFDPAAWVDLFVRCGARYIIPTTKHHDGITLWNAPGTGTRNTVFRGPRRDLIRDLESEVRRAGLRFGVYYSGGLDWSVTDLPAHDLIDGMDAFVSVRNRRPQDAGYAAYAYLHVRDLIDRYHPDVIWNDIEWPDEGKHAGSLGLLELFRYFYAEVPDGVVNDRWGDTHSDFRTSEYHAHTELEKGGAWENCRGIGMSFGYNQVEDEHHLLSADRLCRHFVDVVSRGGNLLLNVGPDARGTIPAKQQAVLVQLGAWMEIAGRAIHGSRPLDTGVGRASEEPWVRWTSTEGHAWAFVQAVGPVQLEVDLDRVDVATADGRALPVTADGATLTVDPPALSPGLPRLVRWNMW